MKNCKVCGKELVKGKKSYCSRECSKWFFDYSKGNKCPDCGVLVSNVATYCQKHSYGKGTKNKRLFGTNCIVCNTKLNGKKVKYCSIACKNKTTSRAGNEVNYCKNCGKKRPYANKFCSSKCHLEYTSNLTLTEWLTTGKTTDTKHGQTPGFIRKYLKELHNNRCSRCGWAEVNPINGICYLEIEHIDGDPFNNSPENLDLICPNCHSLTPTYKTLNIGKYKNTRYSKRQEMCYEYIPKNKRQH